MVTLLPVLGSAGITSMCHPHAQLRCEFCLELLFGLELSLEG